MLKFEANFYRLVYDKPARYRPARRMSTAEVTRYKVEIKKVRKGSGEMECSACWLTENPPISLSPFTPDQGLDSCVDYKATNIPIICDTTCKEFPKMDCQIPVDGAVLELTYSDTDSDGVEVKIDNPEIPNIPLDQPFILSESSITDSGFSAYPSSPPSLLLHLTNSASASHSDYFSNQEELNVLLLCKPRVCQEGDDSDSLLGRPRCVICQLNPCNTCLMHHQSRHTELCYSCASYFSKSHVCPLCPSKIMYIYMYDDI